MDSSSAGVAVSVDSVANDLKNQSLGSDRGDSDDDNHSKRVRLKLEDLNWDHSFTRELPGDRRTDLFPREHGQNQLQSCLIWIIRSELFVCCAA
ncbi:hypothetical protein O6P43_023715 [Quillaja saponaria]|uniref:Uncharacterized protein n=1 Tax=Quillaja saponaria TaxID=32244 RepID=A0AAD7LGI5_QUISA|nr:hypothetical protein O6P43_023715 [Quillaja saponaria]